MTQRMNITLLGHKDHGKSTLIGRLLYDTKSVKEDRVEEVRETCRALEKPFEYAFLLDSFQEEREGGMTIDVIHAQINGKRYLYDCIDVPGHKELIKNMLTGASHADAGILIVSAKEGIEEQTGQHLKIARWLGLEPLVVAVNKMDLTGYDQAVFDDMKDKISTLEGNGLAEKICYVPVSAYLGENVVTRSSWMAWYTGPTLYEYMEGLRTQDSLVQRPLRLPVQGLYAGANGERIIAGRIESGSLHSGQSVVFAPSGATATVEAILAANKNTTVAAEGENVGIVCHTPSLSIKRGEVCCPAEEVARPKKEVVAHAIFLELAPQRVTVECGTAQSECEVGYLGPLEIGEVVQVALRFRDSLVVERSRTSLGRLAIKHCGKIIGVAVVI